MPWYRAGTVTATAGQTTISGDGTSFSANSRVGDAFQGPDGRWYEVTNIASATVMSILPAYQGPTIGGGAYGLAPMQGYVKESADRLRQIVEQWGATLAGLGPLSSVTVAPVANGGTGASTAAGARAALGLGTAATRAVGTVAGNVMEVGAGGLLGVAPSIPAATYLTSVQTCGFTLSSNNADAPAGAPYSAIITVKYPEGFRTAQIAVDIITGQMYARVVDPAGNVGTWRKSYDDTNTTRAADGTLKAI